MFKAGGGTAALPLPSVTTQRNSVNVVREDTPLYQQQQPIGDLPGFDTAGAVAKSSMINRYWLIGMTAVVVVIVVVLGVAAFYSINDRDTHLKRESQTNDAMSATVEWYNYDGGNDYVTCSGAFIAGEGQFLTASHCISSPFICEFDVVEQRYELDSLFLVDVMGVNGTTEKRTFDAQIIGWSGLADVAVMQALPTAPFSPVGPAVDISIVSQDYFRFGSSTDLERGQQCTAISYDDQLMRKLTHTGPIQAIHKDRGGDVATPIEQVFFDGNMRPGGSGGVVIDKDNKIVMGPISYQWNNDVTSSGTSARVTEPLVRRFLDVNTPPNGPVNGYNKYMIPTMGFVSDWPVGFIGYIDYSSSLDYMTHTQSKGVQIDFLYDQAYFEFVTDGGVFPCGLDPYTVEPPSLLNAPLDETGYGEPPALFPSDPTGGNSEVYVIFEAIERNLDQNNWVEVGEDVGLETISGVLLSSGKWVGDVVRARIKAFNPYNTTNVQENWQGVYRVTLRAIDPVWDIPGSSQLLSLSNYIHVDNTNTNANGVNGLKSAGTKLYLNPKVKLPKHLMNSVLDSHQARVEAAQGYKTKTLKRKNGRTVVMDVPNTFANMFSPIPKDLDISTLPTIAQAFRARQRGMHPTNNAVRSAVMRSTHAHMRSGHRLTPALDRKRMHSPPPKRYAPHHQSERAMRELNPNNHHVEAALAIARKRQQERKHNINRH